MVSEWAPSRRARTESGLVHQLWRSTQSIVAFVDGACFLCGFSVERHVNGEAILEYTEEPLTCFVCITMTRS